ncbi:hypothetical protein [Clostridium tagluense]|uniref:Uncharacterized protein n=1 Tax=Clostridium tagluense TaxID=360422 RepID=A0A401UQ77_9CLOT|nr:hypothetical protein [Clostridium tagluense]GCD11684.1 hypothetical protein Ctaglu_33070 [Clostridium tagluense]
MDCKKLTLKEIEKTWNMQIAYMCMGMQDNKVINDLAKEVKERGELKLFEKFQKDVIQCY